MRHWQLQEAKNRLSHVVREAQSSGPQVITHHGKETAVVLSMDAYRELTAPKTSIYDLFRNSPLVGEDLNFERSSEATAVIEL